MPARHAHARLKVPHHRGVIRRRRAGAVGRAMVVEIETHEGGLDRATLLTGAHTDKDVVQALAHLEERVVEAVLRKRPERDPNEHFDRSLTFGQRLSDGVVATMGSWRFII